MSKTPEQALQAEIDKYVKQGYQVTLQTATSAQLVKPKRFAWLLALILLLAFALPFIIYVIIYAGQKDKTVYLSVDERGKVTAR
jgi:hypothetical protein